MFQKECKRNFGTVNNSMPQLSSLSDNTTENMMYLNALGQPFIVFNSLKPAFELLDRRANIYSDRPRFIVLHEILCGGFSFATMQYGDLLVQSFLHRFGTYVPPHSWRRTRRAAHERLTKGVVREYRPVFLKEAILLASAVLKTPDALQSHFERAAASAIMSITYDYPTLGDEHDKTITEIHAFIDRLSAAGAPGAHLVEFFPWMMHIPER
jgi:hypothetical protein